MINLKSLLVYILDYLKKIRLGGIFTGNITVDRTGYSEATFAQVEVISGDGTGNSVREISLMAGSTSSQNAGIYDTADQNWLFYNSGADSKTYVPALAMSSTTSGTIASTFNNANSKRCHLYKIGKIVFAVIGIHYANATSTIPANTTIFTIPVGYRPSSNVTLSGQFSLPATSTGFNKVVIGSLEVSAAGAVTHTVGAEVYSIYCVGIWETN